MPCHLRAQNIGTKSADILRGRYREDPANPRWKDKLGIEAEEDLLDYKSVGALLAILDGQRAFADS